MSAKSLRALHWDEDLASGVVNWSSAPASFIGVEIELPQESDAWDSIVHADDVERRRAGRQVLRLRQQTQWNGTYQIRAREGWRPVREQMVASKKATTLSGS